MRIQLSKFGNILLSRPAGREAVLSIKAYFKPSDEQEKVELDFEGVGVVAPSWLDEVLAGLGEEFGEERVICLSSDNPSVNESLKTIRDLKD